MSDGAPRRTAADDPDDDAVDHVELMTFGIGDRTYAIELGRVDQLVDEYDVERLPRTGPAVDGVTHAGGEITAVVNLPVLFGLSDATDDARPQLITLERDGDQQAVGVEVPVEGDIESVPMAEIEAADNVGGIDTAAPEGVVFAVVREAEGRPPIYVIDVPQLIETALAPEE